MIRGGAARAPLKDRKDDLYETVDLATRTLLRHEPLIGKIWEPCAGRGEISRLLIAAGHDVVASDLNAHEGADAYIVPRRDFLFEREPMEGARTIVTNPPFKNADDFIEHGLSLGCRVIVFLRLLAQEGEHGKHRGSFMRSRHMENHLSHIWLGRERLPMMHREGWTGNRVTNGGIPFAWFVFNPQPHPASFGYRTYRVSWYEKDAA